MHTGHVISGLGHAGFIGWVLFGGAFQSDPEPFEVTEVAVISSAEFAALTAPPSTVTDVALPQTPSEEDAAPEVAAPAPVTPPETPETTEAAEPEDVPEVPQPLPETEVAEEEPPSPPAPDEPINVPVPNISDRPVPRPSERIAPEIVETPDPEAAPDITEQAALAPEPSETPAPPAEAQEQTAPEEAADEIVTEAETPSAAPQNSIRPPARRPTPPVRQAETGPEPQDIAEPEPETDRSAINDAVSEALAGAAAQPDVPQGPPLTSGEREGLRVAVQRCWNVGALSSAALETTVVVAVSMAEDGKPVTSSIRLLSSTGGSEASARQAFEAARRAIIRCGANGYDLPAEKYGQWKDIEMTFNPEGMRLR